MGRGDGVREGGVAKQPPQFLCCLATPTVLHMCSDLLALQNAGLWVSLGLLCPQSSWQSLVRPGCACGEGAQREMAQLAFVPGGPQCSPILLVSPLVSVERLLFSS